MSRIAPLIGALALTVSFAAVAQTPAQGFGDPSLASRELEVNPQPPVPPQASETTNCGPRDQIVAQLGTVFSEAQNGMGIIDQTAVVEVFVSDQGTFTILASGTDGTSCILASGEGWDGTVPDGGKGA